MKSLSPFIIVIVCVIMYFMYITPLTLEVKTLADKKVQYDDVLIRTEEIVSTRDSIKAKYDNISPEDFIKLNKIIPATFNPLTFINDVSFLVTQNGLLLRDYKVSENGSASVGREVRVGQVENRSYKTNTVSMIIEGKYEDFVRLLSRIESSLQLVDVTSLSIRPASTERLGVELFTYSLEINTYSLN